RSLCDWSSDVCSSDLIRTSNSSSTSSTIRLQNIAVDRYSTFAECFHIRDRSQASADQSLYLVRSTRWTATSCLARSACLRRARQHRIFGSEPTLPAVSQKR